MTNNFKILKEVNAVRKVPTMYIGNLYDIYSVHKLILELIDNSIDEYINKFCSFIMISIYDDNIVSVSDNGNGISMKYNYDLSGYIYEIIMTNLHSGEKFNNNMYKFSGGVHGVGVSVVNFLSKRLYIKIFKNNYIYEQYYIYGLLQYEIRIISKTKKNGLNVIILPDKNIFNNIIIIYYVLLHKIKELLFLNNKIIFNFFDYRLNKFILLWGSNINFFIKHLVKKDLLVNKNPIYISGKKEIIFIEFTLQWIESIKNIIYGYTNNIYQILGGIHCISLKNVINKILKNYLMIRSNKDIINDDIQYGLISIISIMIKNPKFNSQDKSMLLSDNLGSLMEKFIELKLNTYFYNNIEILKIILNRIIYSCKIRNLIKKKKNYYKLINYNDLLFLPEKLFECINNKFNELFIVEGESAGGSVKLARNKYLQAVLPIKGKFLNIEKINKHKFFIDEELSNILKSIGYILENNKVILIQVRYSKIILMTDADIDGSHIKILLLTFFFRKIPYIISSGFLYISSPPLLMLKKNNNIIYIENNIKYNLYICSILCKRIFSYFKCNIINFLLLKNIVIMYNNLILFFEKNLKKIYLLFYNFFIEFIILDIFFDIKNYYCLLEFNLLNDLKIYFLSFNFFYSLEFILIIKLNKLLNIFFKYNKFIKIFGKFYYYYNFDKLLNIVFLNICNEYYIQRYKGLGEMNIDQLWYTVMNPKYRNVDKILINNILNTNRIFNLLMGNNFLDKKQFINKYILFSI